MFFLILLYWEITVILCKKNEPKMQIEAVSGILSSDLYDSLQSTDASQTIPSFSILEDNNDNQNDKRGQTILHLQNMESISPSEDMFPLRNKKFNDIYMKSVKEKKISSIHDLNRNIAENYPDSMILTRNKDGDVLTKANISEIKNMLSLIKPKSLPKFDENELESFPSDGSLVVEEPFLHSKTIMDKFSDVFTILSSIPKEMRVDILVHTFNVIQSAGENLSNLPNMFIGDGIHYLLQPLTDVSLNPSEIIKIYSSLFEGVEENFLIFLEIVERIFLLALSSSNIIPPTASRKLKVLESTYSKTYKSQGSLKQQSINFWYNTICQTIQNIELLNVVYSFLIPQKKEKKSVETIDTLKTPTLAGFREIVEKELQEKTEITKKISVKTQDVIFDGWKEVIHDIGHSINSKFSETKSLCIKYKLITSQKENIDSINESYQVRKFKGLLKELKDDEKLSENDKLTHLISLGLEKSSIKLSTDERQSIITMSTNFLLSIAEDLSEVDLLSKCFSFILNSKSISDKNNVLKMDTVLEKLLKQPHTIDKIPIKNWKSIVTLIPQDFKKSCTIALHSQYIDCYKKYKELHYTLQQPTVVTSIINELEKSGDIIGDVAAKSVTTNFSWKSLYQADATFTYYFSILELNRLIAFNQIIIDVVMRYEPIKDLFSIPPKETRKSKALRLWNSIKGAWLFRIATFGIFSLIGYIDKGYTVEKCLFIPKARRGEPEPTIIW